MIHLHEAVVGVNKRPIKIGPALKKLEPGDKLWFSSYSINRKIISVNKVQGAITGIENSQYRFKRLTEEGVFSLNVSGYQYNNGNKILSDGYDDSYIAIKTNDYIFAYAMSETKLDEIIAKYFK